MGRAAAIMVAAAMLAAACGTDSGDVAEPPLLTLPPGVASTTTVDVVPDQSTSPAELSDSSVDGDLADAGAVIEQVDCPIGLSRSDGRRIACGTASVVIDRSDPESSRVTIGIATLAGSNSDSPRPLAVLQGGPGGASTDLAEWFSPQPFTQVFIDQRGTGFAGPDFNCIESELVMGQVLSSSTEEGRRVSIEAYAACAERLRDNEVLQHTTTEAHAADVADVMSALGYDDWAVYGVSYGSTIGIELLAEAPAGLTGVVLDGVYPPELDADEGVIFSAGHALDALDAACLDSAECRALVDGVSVRAIVERVMVDFDRDPMVVPLAGTEVALDRQVDVILDGAAVAEMSFLLLYQESLMRFLPAVLAGLDDRDPASAQWLTSTAGRLAVLSGAANDEATYFAVQCHDRAPFTDGPGVTDDVFAAAIVPISLDALCEPWQRTEATADVAAPAQGSLPVLLLSGEFDPITPPDYADDVASRLEQAITVEHDGRGHGIWNGSDCIASIVVEFVAAPGTDLAIGCAVTGAPVEWARP